MTLAVKDAANATVQLESTDIGGGVQRVSHAIPALETATGAKTDTEITVSSATPFSVIAILKGIWTRCGAAIPAGSALIGKVDLSVNGTTVTASAPAPVTSGTGYASNAFARPANTTAYTANDVVGDNAAGLFTFTNMGLAGKEIMLTSASFEYDVSAIPSGMTSITLHLFDSAPTAMADNAAFALSSADAAKYLGSITFYPGVVGSVLWGQLDAINKQVKLAAADTSLYGYLVTAGAFTPTSAATGKVKLHAIGV